MRGHDDGVQGRNGLSSVLCIAEELVFPHNHEVADQALHNIVTDRHVP